MRHYCNAVFGIKLDAEDELEINKFRYDSHGEEVEDWDLDQAAYDRLYRKYGLTQKPVLHWTDQHMVKCDMPHDSYVLGYAYIDFPHRKVTDEVFLSKAQWYEWVYYC
jgi:hypothetical protein